MDAVEMTVDAARAAKDALPLVTFALFAYNQEAVVADAMQAALAQDYGRLEIIVSDDCSTDGTWAVIQSIADSYRGPHALRVVRNASNMGIGPHVSHVGMQAHGDLVVVAAGDDYSVPERVSQLVKTWVAHGKPEGALHSAVLVRSRGSETISKGAGADPEKATLDYFVRNHFRGLFFGAAAAYTKGVFSRFPPLQTPFEDIALTFRALLIGRVVYVDAVLVHYDFNDSSISRPLRIRDQERVRKWFSTIQKNMEGLQADYLHYIRSRQATPDAFVLNEIHRIEQRCSRAKGLGSRDPVRLLIGMLSYPYDVPLRNRIGFYLGFFGLR